MRVIAGQMRGKRLKTLDGLDVRPTTDRVKEALFSIIQFDLPGAQFLDLFAGSGQNGIEALSRGAEYCYFVDQNKKAVDVVCDNLRTVGAEGNSKVVATEAKSFLARTDVTFDIAFLDPPYHHDILPEMLPLLAEKMSPQGIVICEHEKNEEIPQQVGGLYLKKQYQYGKLMLSKYVVGTGEEE